MSPDDRQDLGTAAAPAPFAARSPDQDAAVSGRASGAIRAWRISGSSLRARLTAAFSGVALLSTALTLGLHDRALTRDLEAAALTRLEVSAESVRLLSERHLGALSARYAAASSSRWLRDLLRVPDRQGLDDFALPVGGAPRETALRWLREHEQLERGWYAGAGGYVDADGGGELAVSLRSALLRDGDADVFAGAGIVAGSDPEAELRETRLKLRALVAPLLEL